MWMPMMLFSGLMSMVMFADIMSFMGMAMNPAESAQTEARLINQAAVHQRKIQVQQLTQEIQVGLVMRDLIVE